MKRGCAQAYPILGKNTATNNTPAVLPNGPAYPLDTHNQPPHKRPCTSQHICATPEPQSHTVPDWHTNGPSNDAEANGDSSLRRGSCPLFFFYFFYLCFLCVLVHE